MLYCHENLLFVCSFTQKIVLLSENCSALRDMDITGSQSEFAYLPAAKAIFYSQARQRVGGKGVIRL